MADGSAFYEEMSATLLSSQPAEPVPVTPLASWPQLQAHLESRLRVLENWRFSWWEHWQLLAEYILPRRYHWLITPNTMNRGLPISQNIVDPTGTLAMRICASGLMSGLTSPSRPWFKLRIAGEDADLDYAATLWLDEVERRIYHVMAKSNFYDAMAQMYEDEVVFGTAPMLIYEDERDVIRCYNPCAGEYFLGASSTLRIDTFYRKFVFTVMQIVDMFGLDHVPDTIQKLWTQKSGNLDSERIVAHSIEPNFDIAIIGSDSTLKVLDNFTYREAYWLWGERSLAPLSLRGFNEVPFIAPRWAITSNDAYGRSPGMDTLPDIMQLQVETKRKAEAIEKLVRPPMLASVELKNEPSSTLPGHVTYVSNLSANSGFRPAYTVDPKLDHLTRDLAEIQDRVRRGFFNDLFLMMTDIPNRDRVTAYEIAEKNQEKLQVLGPVIERMQNEGHSPAIRRIVHIMTRKGMFPDPPQSMRGKVIDIEYISMLALAQRAVQSAGMDRLLQVVGQVGALDQGAAYDNLDGDEFVNTYAQMMTVPYKIMKSRESVQQLRTQRAQAQQAKEMAAMAQTMGNNAAMNAKTLSDTDVGGGVNALQMMLEGEQPQL